MSYRYDDRGRVAQRYPEDDMDVYRSDRQGPFIWVDRRDILWTYDRDNRFVECDQDGRPYEDNFEAPRYEGNGRSNGWDRPSNNRGVSRSSIGRTSSRQEEDRNSVRPETKNRRNKVRKNKPARETTVDEPYEGVSLANKLDGLKPEKGNELVPFLENDSLLDIAANGKLFRFIVKENK